MNIRWLSLITALALTACAQPAPAIDAGEAKGVVAVLDLPYESTPSVDEAADASEELGWLAVQNGEGLNRVVSPSSLSMSLVQAAEGARGRSLESIDDVLGLTGDHRARAFGALRQSLTPYDDLPTKVDADDPPETPVVHQASRVLAVDSELQQPFLDRLSEFYDAPAEQVTLADAKPNLDAWVTKHTAGLIPQSAVTPDGSTVAVLQDALLFAAAWAQEFTGEPTIPFDTPDGPKPVDGLAGTFSVRFAGGERWTAVRLPYDDALAADVILPRPGVDPLELTERELAEARFVLAQAEPEPVDVTMPAFDLTAKTDLLEALPDIDLSDLGGIVEDGFAAQWVQQAKLIVTAKGTVGAAVTEMAIATSAGSSVEVRTFTVDRPYVFRVLDTRTGWPLFLAAISDPSEES
ncbi:serpin family protein [Tessaracoccus sp. ZS01]|uniref:serpin family protein n=1 Tax=Tessaracoccus sp. ZS01 TaxID=1906324 RepID=UPI0009FB4B1C|nr:serpin family protein [Tessaracoccus sp. ZS01]MCG6568575.1 serpin family protein [Tessaracoccus sp. ZS01]